MSIRQITEAVTALDVAQMPGLVELSTGESSFSPARAFTTGRDAKGRFAPRYRQLTLCVTDRGHWFRSDDEPDGLHNDTLCRGCGHHGHFAYILDYKPCTAPASAPAILAAMGGGR